MQIGDKYEMADANPKEFTLNTEKKKVKTFELKTDVFCFLTHSCRAVLNFLSSKEQLPEEKEKAGHPEWVSSLPESGSESARRWHTAKACDNSYCRTSSHVSACFRLAEPNPADRGVTQDLTAGLRLVGGH